MKYILFILVCFVFSFDSIAQEEPDINVAGIKFLDYGTKVPEELLSSKSVVLLQVPPKEGTSIRGDYNTLANEGHEVFKKTGIDPVAYFLMEDVLSSRDASIAFAEEMKAREVKYLIILSDIFVKIKGKISERFVLLITPFNGNPDLMDNGQAAWKDQNKKLEKVLDNIYKDASKQDITRTNHLVTDTPEFYFDLPVIKGKRLESYISNLKNDKLAIARFEVPVIPDNRPGGLINKNVEKEAETAIKQANANNAALERLAQEYPFEYGLVDYNSVEEKLWSQGYRYILYPIHTTGRSIRYQMNYEVDDDEEDYVTPKMSNGKIVLRNIPADAPVYKYYIKHLRNKDVYLGNKWDADERWEDAFKNHIDNLKVYFKL